MAIWKPNDVKTEPETKLMSWQVYEVPIDGKPSEYTTHYVGVIRYGGFGDSSEGRVSSAIQTFDKSEMCGISRSGRKYILTGSPCFNRDADYVWKNWCHINKVEYCLNVTDQYSGSSICENT